MLFFFYTKIKKTCKEFEAIFCRAYSLTQNDVTRLSMHQFSVHSNGFEVELLLCSCVIIDLTTIHISHNNGNHLRNKEQYNFEVNLNSFLRCGPIKMLAMIPGISTSCPQ